MSLTREELTGALPLVVSHLDFKPKLLHRGLFLEKQIDSGSRRDNVRVRVGFNEGKAALTPTRAGADKYTGVQSHFFPYFWREWHETGSLKKHILHSPVIWGDRSKKKIC